MTTDRRLYNMDLGRRDHTRWLGSNRYAGGGPPPFSYADIPNQLLRINSLEGSLAFSGAVLTGVTDVSPVGGTVNVTGSPTYTATDSGLNNAPSFTPVASSSVIAPNVNRASIRFVAAVFFRTSTVATSILCDGTVISNRYYTFFNADGNVQNSYGSYLAAATLEPTIGRKRCLFPNNASTVGKLNAITLSALPVGTASGNGLTLGSAYSGAGAGNSRLAFFMPLSAAPSAPLLAALEAKLITDFG